MGDYSGLVVLALVTLPMSTSSAVAGDRKEVRDVLAEARAAKDGDEKVMAYLRVDAESVGDEADVQALYLEFFRLETELKSKDSGRLTRVSEHLANVLASCQDPKYRRIIKELVDKENAELGTNYWGPWAVKSELELMRETPRYARLSAVLEAAGKGKNDESLPALRNMRKKGGQAGKMAETAIARIGRDEDLDEFIREIKADDKCMTSLYGFGRKGTARVIRELNDPQVSELEKRRVAGQMPQYVPQEDLPAIFGLLKHPDQRIVKIAARTLGGSLTTRDEVLLRDLIKNRDQAIRGPAIRSLERIWDEKFLPLALDILKTDPDAGNRSFVIHLLISHKVRAAEAALLEAANVDSAPWVREEAREALKSITQ